MKKYLLFLSVLFASCTPRLMIEATFPDNATPQEKSISMSILRQRLEALYPGTEAKTDSAGTIMFSIPIENDTTSYRFLLAHRGQLRIFETYNSTELDSALKKMEESYVDTAKTITQEDTASNKYSLFLQNKEANTAEVADSQPLLGRPEILMRNRQPGAILGMCQPADTIYVNKMLQYSIQSGIFPKGIRFMWGLPDYNKVVALYAIKPPLYYAPVRNDMIRESKVEISDHGSFDIRFGFKEEYYDFWERMTRNNIGKCLAMCIDNIVYFCPVVNSTIKSGDTIISGAFTREEALVISTMITYGEIPVPMTIMDK